MDYLQLSNRYTQYIESLKITDPHILEHVNFKVDHTFRVVDNIERISGESGLTEKDTELAKIIGLVHDIGRHVQFIKYKTFDDSISENHAALGVTILNDSGFLDGAISKADSDLVIRAVLNHNIQKLDGRMNERVLLFSKLIRDADKVDIWNTLSTMNIVFKIMGDEEEETGYIVPSAFTECFRSERIVPSGAVSINDYRLLRLGWIYDMNFPATFRIIRENNYAAKILSRIPSSPALNEIADIIHGYIQRKADEGLHE